MALLRRGKEEKISEHWLLATGSLNPATLHILPVFYLPKALVGTWGCVAEAELQLFRSRNISTASSSSVYSLKLMGSVGQVLVATAGLDSSTA